MLGRVFLQSAVTADFREVVAFTDIEPEVTGFGGIYDAPALRRPGTHSQLWILTAVDQQRVAFASKSHACRAARVRRRQRAILPDLDVAQNEHELVVDADSFRWIFNEQRAVQTKADLLGRHHVRVIP